MSGFSDSLQFLSVRPPRLSTADVAWAVESQYGLRGHYKPLVSERDQNFRLSAVNGHDYVVKVSNPQEAELVTGRQVELLLHLEKCSDPATPTVIRATSGDCSVRFESAGDIHSLRVVSYLDGTPLSSLELTEGLVAEFGARLASLDKALASFPATGENPFSLWDLQQAAALRDLQQHISDPDVHSLVARTLDRFEALVAPQLRKLPRQAIHGDANPENVLVDGVTQRVSGFIDFGDTVFAPRVVDLAIAASYMRAAEPEPRRFINKFFEAYQSVQPLDPAELDLLPDLVRTRLAATITMLYWRLSAREENDPYRKKTLQSEGSAVTFLRALEHF